MVPLRDRCDFGRFTWLISQALSVTYVAGQHPLVRSITEECLDRVGPLGERHVRHLLREYVAYSHHERTHQGRGTRILPWHLSVSNSLSGRHWELDQVPAVGDPTDIVQLGTGHHVSAGEGQRRVALQPRISDLTVVRLPIRSAVTP